MHTETPDAGDEIRRLDQQWGEIRTREDANQRDATPTDRSDRQRQRHDREEPSAVELCRRRDLSG